MTILFRGFRKVDVDGEVDGFWMTIDGPTITATGSGESPRAEGATVVEGDGRLLTPGFIDLHCHGGGGHAFEGSADDILAALDAHAAHGTTRSVLSLVANPIPELEASLATIAELTRRSPRVLGAHLEGPYLSPKHPGAHNPDYLRDPQPAELDRLLEAAHGTLRQITLAPELDNALELIPILSEQDVVVAVGHTDADYATAQAAFRAGARLLTHAFNAMNGIHHRAPGPVVAALENDAVTLELVLDGIHVVPEVAALLFANAPGRVVLVSDAMAAAAVGDGHYELGSLGVDVVDGVARLAGTDTIAGSTLTLDVALRIAVERVGVPLAEAVAALTAVPARVLGRSDLGRLAPGCAADAVTLDARLEVQSTWIAGEQQPGH